MLNNSPQLKNLYEILSVRVKHICRDRDDSHGHLHMKSVCDNSLRIVDELKIWDKNDIKDIMVVAWLHDINDHKYSNAELEKELDNLLEEVYPNKKQKQSHILNIIERISYSKENKTLQNNEKLDWLDVLGSKGILIRNIVSDADKLEAIGKVGFERCVEYTKHSYKEKHNCEIPFEDLVKEVKNHADEKLLRLKDDFIRTTPGKKMAEPLHDELLEELSKMESVTSNE